MRRRPQLTLAVGVLAASVALWPSVLQGQVEVAPALGTYIPLGGGWTQESDGGTGLAPRRRQRAAHMLATRVSVWTSQRVAFEGTFAYSPSQVAVSVDGRTTDIAGGVLLASARVLFKLTTLKDGYADDPTHWDVIVGAGGGLVHRGGTAWENTSGVTVPAAVLTAVVAAPLAGSLTWRVGLEDFVSWTQFDAGLPSQTQARLHHDLVGSLAVVVPLAGR